MIDIAKVLPELAIKRPIFHSEADFQHALAWEIHEKNPEYSIRLEQKPPHSDERIYVDLCLWQNNSLIAIELKYKTRNLKLEVKQESFDLLDQSAQDVGRYDFIKDIQRLEGITAMHTNAIGFAVFLSNDSSYWKISKDTKTVDSNFRMHEGREISGRLAWGTGASAGTMRGREKPLIVKGKYKLTWQDYSEPSKVSHGKFRYLLVKANNK